jgi:hypothetical protein
MAFAAQRQRAEGDYRGVKSALNKLKSLKISICHSYAKSFQNNNNNNRLITDFLKVNSP